MTTCTGVSGSARKVGSSIASSGEHSVFGFEPVNGAVFETKSHDTLANAVLYDKIQGEVFNEIVAVVSKRLPIQRVQHAVTYISTQLMHESRH